MNTQKALETLDILHYRIESQLEQFGIDHPWEDVSQNFLDHLKFDFGDNPTPDQVQKSLDASLAGLEELALDYGVELDY